MAGKHSKKGQISVRVAVVTGRLHMGGATRKYIKSELINERQACIVRKETEGIVSDG